MDFSRTLILDLSPDPLFGSLCGHFCPQGAGLAPKWARNGLQMETRIYQQLTKKLSASLGAPTADLCPPGGGPPPKSTKNPLKLEQTSSKCAAEYR